MATLYTEEPAILGRGAGQGLRPAACPARVRAIMTTTGAGGRRIGLWLVIGGGAAVALLVAALLAWSELPKRAPLWTMKNSPWTALALRGAAQARALMMDPSNPDFPEDGRRWQASDIPLLVRALADEHLHESAVVALGLTGDPGAVPHLARALAGHGDRRVRRYAARMLAHGTDRAAATTAALAGLGDADGEVRMQALRTLAVLASPTMVPGIDAAMSTLASTQRMSAITALGRVDDAASSAVLVRLLSDEEEAVRAHAAVTLAGRSHPGVVVALARALDDRSPEVRDDALMALIGTTGDGSSRALIAHLARIADDRDRSFSRVVAVLEALADRGDADAVTATFSTLMDGDDELRKTARRGLRRHATVADLPRLEPALASSSPKVRGDALFVCGGWKAWEPIVAALRDPDPGVRRMALSQLVTSGSLYGHEVIAMFADPDGQVRLSAVSVAGLIGDVRAIQPLLRLLGTDPEERVRAAARQMLLERIELSAEQRAQVERTPADPPRP